VSLREAVRGFSGSLTASGSFAPGERHSEWFFIPEKAIVRISLG
jgi:hypothetical protein